MARTGAQIAPVRAFRSLLGTDPFRELMDVQRRINEMFDDSVGRSHEDAALNTWTPAVDVFEDANGFVIKAELPEVKQEDVKVNLDGNILSITGTRNLENEEKREGYHRIERSYGQFYRSFTLPPNADKDAVAAEFRNGMLRLHIPKKEEAKPKQIEVRIG